MDENAQRIHAGVHIPLTLAHVSGEIHLTYHGSFKVAIVCYGPYIDWQVIVGGTSTGDAGVMDVDKVIFDVNQALQEV